MVGVAEAGADGGRAPANHSDTENAVCSEPLDGDDPEYVTDNISDLMEG